MPRGGKRAGSGRKPLPVEKKKCTFSAWVTAEQREKLKEILIKMRSKK